VSQFEIGFERSWVEHAFSRAVKDPNKLPASVVPMVLLSSGLQPLHAVCSG
jgi:hypothetical protein